MNNKSNFFNSNKIKSRIVTAAANAQEGHIPSALSILDIVWVLYNKVMKFNDKPFQSDRFVLSKGHASLAIYAVLEDEADACEARLVGEVVVVHG